MNSITEAKHPLDVVTSQLLKELLLFYGIGALLILIIASLLVVSNGWTIFAGVQMLGAGSLFIASALRNHLPLNISGQLLIFSFTAMGLNSMLAIGVAGRGPIMLILASYIAFFTLSRKAGVAHTLLGLTMFVLLGFLQNSGQLAIPSHRGPELLNQNNWVNSAFFYGFVVYTLTIFQVRYRQLAEGLLSQEQEINKDLLAAYKEADRANAEKTAFLARMSHELRTPLNVMLGFTQLLQLHPEQQRESRLDSINVAGEHLLVLINETLDLMGIEEGRLVVEKVEVEVEPIIEECITLLSTQANAVQVSLHTNVSSNPLTIKGDPLRVKQVLLNLLSNGIKYNRPQGSVYLRAQTVDKDWVEIEITDTGIGIAEEDKDKLFEAFTRFGDKQTHVDGTGVGLTISRQLVGLMGGEIVFTSQLGMGSTFRVTLPR
ncbi:MAG: signal transduction histidine kinase [Halioglobus sp.]|jgi:signal transduction histidine kinase